jgi:hypothetical protein
MGQKTAKYLLISVLVVISILMIIPLLHYHYIYPTAGDDTATHMIYFQNMDKQPPLYGGQFIVGKLMNALPFDMSVNFLWYHYCILILAIWCIGLSVGFAINYLAGILVSLGVICINGLLELFHWGQIFDIVGIAILLPIALLCLHKIDKGLWWKVGAVVSLIVFSLWHLNGKFIYALLPMIIIYEIAVFVITRKNEKLAQKICDYRFLYYTGVLGLILFVLYKIGYKPALDSGRLWMDGSILIVLCVSGIAGLWLNKKGNTLMSLAVIVFVISLSIPNWLLWFQDNSAVKDADKEAIAYLNSLDGETYTASPQVAQDIYGLFVNKEFLDYLGADYVVTRTMPMTPRSDPNNLYYENGGREYMGKYMNLWGYKPLTEFNKGEMDNIFGESIKVTVYGK